MTVYLIDHADLVGLYGYRTYLERLEERIESFKIIFDLVPPHEFGRYRETALAEVTERVRREKSLWPDMVKPLRQLHQVFALFIREANRFVTQLDGYKALQGRKGTLGNLNNLAMHLEPFNS